MFKQHQHLLPVVNEALSQSQQISTSSSDAASTSCSMATNTRKTQVMSIILYLLQQLIGGIDKEIPFLHQSERCHGQMRNKFAHLCPTIQCMLLKFLVQKATRRDDAIQLLETLDQQTKLSMEQMVMVSKFALFPVFF